MYLKNFFFFNFMIQVVLKLKGNLIFMKTIFYRSYLGRISTFLTKTAQFEIASQKVCI